MATEPSQVVKPQEPPPPGPLPDHDEDQWLFVEGFREGADGGWATGTFDAKRNKLTITTRDVTLFVIDVSRVPIDWQRPVILGIDGSNSELRRREADRLHVRRDAAGWTIDEP